MSRIVPITTLRLKAWPITVEAVSTGVAKGMSTAASRAVPSLDRVREDVIAAVLVELAAILDFGEPE